MLTVLIVIGIGMHPQLELSHILEVVGVLAEGECERVETMLVVFLSTKQEHQQM